MSSGQGGGGKALKATSLPPHPSLPPLPVSMSSGQGGGGKAATTFPPAPPTTFPPSRRAPCFGMVCACHVLRPWRSGVYVGLATRRPGFDSRVRPPSRWGAMSSGQGGRGKAATAFPPTPPSRGCWALRVCPPAGTTAPRGKAQ